MALPDAQMVETESTSTTVQPAARHTRVGARLPPLSLETRVQFEGALGSLNRARGWAKYSEARKAFLTLSDDALASVLHALGDPQPPPVRDVLQAFLAQHIHLNYYIHLATSRERSPWLRSVLAEVLTSRPEYAEEPSRDIILAALERMSRDPDLTVVIAAAEGVGRLGVRTAIAEGILRNLEQHPNIAVRTAASEALQADAT